MPYKAGKSLPGEHASKLGHLEVLDSELINDLLNEFTTEVNELEIEEIEWIDYPIVGEPLSYIFSVDGSYQEIKLRRYKPEKVIAYVKTAILKFDQKAIGRINEKYPHPLELRSVLKGSSSFHATVFPLKNVSKSNKNVYNTVREIVFQSLKDPLLSNLPYETFKWLAYEKWSGDNKPLPMFDCPHCRNEVATLTYNQDRGQCPNCGNEIFVTDMLGFHLDMNDNWAPTQIASTYMLLHETLLLFSGVKYFWENDKEILKECLFLKDGPLYIRAQYSKLVAPIRRFLAFARDEGYEIHIAGQEKSGHFFDYLESITQNRMLAGFFIPNNQYILETIQHRPLTSRPYGRDTNYGAKIFVIVDKNHKFILNIPTGEFNENPNQTNLIGFNRILATLPKILSYKYEGALLPIELANKIASLSTYPSAQILKLFTESKGI